MKKKLLFGMAMFLGLSTTTIAQERYLEEVFTDAEIIIVADQPYGVNVNFLLSDLSDQVVAQAELTQLQIIAATGGQYPLKWFYPNNPTTPVGDSTNVKISAQMMDIYMPVPGVVDQVTDRPVIIYAHTGNFLPKGINGQPTGDKNDSAAVEFCKQFAKRGYVAIAINYRLGWNPISPDLDTRTGTLLNAVYRAIHDVKQVVRVVKESSLPANGNLLAINPDNILVFGQGSGGYVSLAYGSMTDASELNLDKFLDINGNSYITPALVGGVDGFGGVLNLYQDTFSVNGITSDVKMTANAGGALADISWIEAGEPAIVSIHSIRDPYAPFDTGMVIVPSLGYNVVNVNGPGTYMPKVNALGNNDAFLGMWNVDDYSYEARSRYGQTFDYIHAAPKDKITLATDLDGLYPLEIANAPSTFQNSGAPWEWWDLADLQGLEAYYASIGIAIDAVEIDSNSLFGNSNGHDKSSALAYIDTVQAYLHPRVMRVLEIGNWEPLSVNDVEVNNVFSIYPNPANTEVTVFSKGGNVKAIKIFDATGRLVYTEVLNVTTATVNISSLSKGMYVISVNTENGENVEKLIIE